MSKKIRDKVHDTWITPSEWRLEQQKRFGFSDFDPCPPDCDTAVFNGLAVEWDDCTFANIPYSQQLKEKFLWKGYEEAKKDKTVIILCPVSTSTKIFHELILPTATIEFLRGRLPFEGIDNDGNWCNPYVGGMTDALIKWRHENCMGRPEVKRSGQQDLMLVIWEKIK